MEGKLRLSDAIVYLCFGILGGVFLASLFGIATALISGTVLCLGWLIFIRKHIFVVSILIPGFALGLFGMNLELHFIGAQYPDHFKGSAAVIGDPVMKSDYQRVILEPIDSENSHKRLIAFTPLYPRFQSQDRLYVECILKKPENKNDGFDYVRYLAKDGIYRICAKASLKPLNNGQRAHSAFLFDLKRKIENSIERSLPEPESSYLAGLLLGGSDRLPKDIAEAFRLTGTTHTVAVSGHNITIIAGAISVFLLFCGMWRKQAFWFSVIGIVSFVYCIGAPSSAVRAAIMAICVLWAAKNGRLANSGKALLFAATAMVMWSPLILIYDVGFQLSFLATLGIVYIYAPLAEKLDISRDFLELRSIILITFSAQIAVAGIIIYQFGAFSPYSLAVNFIILPLIPVIMLIGFIMIVLSFVSMAFAQPFAIGVWALLHFEIETIEFFSHIPYVNIGIENVSAAWLALYYIFIAGIIIYLQKPRMLYPEK
ncbi:MAG: ComEC/Rec2 family competence protein [Patescibacteria group bacterium]|nr:ComEC/Rec2 family competence protein [Patescibacteria group bacterium]